MADSKKPEASKPVSIVCVGMAGEFMFIQI